jgi:uroporphyrinogen III methyltransferase/synthase
MMNTENQEELERLLDGVDIAAIGPITAKTVTDNGLQVTVEPEQHTISEMIWSITQHYSGEKS